MGEAIVITSGKGGVGKTTSAAAIGCALAKRGKSVVLLDADIGLRNLDVMLGLEDRVVYDFVDVIESRCRLSQALIKDKRYEKLYMLAASQTKDKDEVDSEQMIKLCRELCEEFDYLIIDCPAGIEKGFYNAVAGADRAVVIATADSASVRDADRILGRIEEMGKKKIQLIINRICPEMIKNGTMLGVDEVIEILAAELLGIVPDDADIAVAASRGISVTDSAKSVSGQAYRNIAARIDGKTVPIMSMKQKKSFAGKIRGIFTKKNEGIIGEDIR